jgi:putative tryptophan/tyrosine transport system substrate-binding protein
MLLAGVAVCVIARTSSGQSRRKLPLVGVMLYRAEDEPDLALATLRRGLRDLGYVEGQNIIIEPRWADGSFERATRQAEELVGRKVDVIVAATTPLARAAWNSTRTIPIVASTTDSVALGFAKSLSRPGGNLTGVSLNVLELTVKQLELLREMLPGHVACGIPRLRR